MKLIFDIIKNGRDFPKKRNFHFNMANGIIGRSEDCDFYLVDSQNYISNQHAVIEYKHGIYFIKDISTNGTFLKSPYKRLPKNMSIKINSTDIFIIGDYEIQARFIDDDYSQDDIVSYKSQLEYSNVESSIRVPKQVIPDDDFFLEDSSIMNNSFVPQEDENYDTNIMNVFEKEEEEQFDDLYDFEKEPFFENGEDIGSVSNQLTQEHINIPKFEREQSEITFDVKKNKESEVLITQEETSKKEKNLQIYSNQEDEALLILEKKLGISLKSLSKEEKKAKLEEIAQIVINSLDGLKNSLEVKDKIKKDLSIDNVGIKKDDNPVKMGQYALNLLNDRLDKNSLKLSEAIKKSFNELNIHNIALHRSSKNLINIAATKFSPKSLELYFESNGEINSLMPKKYQMWDAYVKMFKKINEDQDFGINFIAKDFSKEYNNICYTIKLTSI
ncbi:type VI secretion system-associated FHA domain protein TagH [Halarcobacter anaerophilus]|uniref:Type VI secretion system-associated FHA domain protein TagH n=1 Tax=Halarcobacter anaerophilus TaxID=877500 RepID=A0A4Q0XZA6_9BACT|nr:type VI secretion system-associated FHA domain protein TagH [Halarcobacter anaerophilus]QDF28484.1 type VI secretion system-associated FHA domain-containing protein TagH [Halarcobacter anaerophilus]RXJ61291.1 type VI secretion system-associated FHA domain protein TagH [Halarcobacter anaerophilus]